MIKPNKYSIALIGTLFLAGASGSSTVQSSAAQKDDLDDHDVKVVSSQELAYPPIARQTAVQGVVVVEAKLDDNGSVESDFAISGNKLLIPETLANAKNWKFEPNARKSAVIVYDFRMVGAVCPGPAHSIFQLIHKNFAKISVCSPVVVGSSAVETNAQQEDTSDDSEAKVVSSQELAYPPLARQTRLQGVVVVNANLDESGNVESVDAISGNKVFMRETLANAKKWKFEPNSKKSAVIVYEFGSVEDTCYKNEPSKFQLVQKNLATISMCSPVITGAP